MNFSSRKWTDKIKTIVIVLLSATAGFWLYPQKESLFEMGIKQDSVFLSANELKQGETLLIKIGSPLSGDKITGEFNAKKIDFFQQENSQSKTAILGIDVNEELGEHTLIINFSDGKKFERKINIIKTEFPITELLVTKALQEKGYTPKKIFKNLQNKEGPLIKKIIGAYTPEAYFNKAFINPLKDIKIVGIFGIIKKTGDSTAQHLGVDLDAKIDTPVFAINDGLVVFSEELPDYGKTIIIDHGLGIFSLYLHLNEFKTLKGAKVKQGNVIGLSGNTGYSIAPHLHFSIKINRANVDPLKFIEAAKSKFDFSE